MFDSLFVPKFQRMEENVASLWENYSLDAEQQWAAWPPTMARDQLRWLVVPPNSLQQGGDRTHLLARQQGGTPPYPLLPPQIDALPLRFWSLGPISLNQMVAASPASYLPALVYGGGLSTTVFVKEVRLMGISERLPTLQQVH